MKKDKIDVDEETLVTSGNLEVSDFSKVVDILLNDNYSRRKTILNNRQVAKITTIDVLSQIYEVEFLKHWISYFSEWRTSGDNGKGRKDIVDISKFNYATMMNRSMDSNLSDMDMDKKGRIR